MISPPGSATTTEPETAQNLAAQPRHPVTQPLVAVGPVHLLGEPAAHLHARIGGEQPLDAEAGTQLVPQLLSAPEVDPRRHFIRREAERHSCEEAEPGRLGLPVVFRRVVHVGDARRYRIERLEGAHHLAGAEHFHPKPSPRCVGDRPAHSLGARSEAGQALRPARDQLQLADPLRDRGRGNAAAAPAAAPPPSRNLRRSNDPSPRR